MSEKQNSKENDISTQEKNTPCEKSKKYQVLARKYRPTSFHNLIGQDALVRTLTNAIKEQRIAHAYILTGVRGIGKTSTARIIAKALNCIGKDGNGEATTDPCGKCENCVAIAQDRHVDVLEMDAASRTGVSDVREILDGVRYKPTSARFKIYIIDEVHMLSKSAFNALLKTLEEPPEHVKFIFATTEIRKVPVTVLSRCQRFDLRRVDVSVLSEHFKKIVELEDAQIEDEALKLIAKAADGSVRDGLSLLDQAIAHSSGNATAEQVRQMIGLADKAIIFELFDTMMKGDTKKSLEIVENQYSLGSDPLVIVQDLLEFNYWLTKAKIVPDTLEDPSVTENERTKGGDIAQKLSMASLTKIWQILLKGLKEVQTAPSALHALEMLIIRICYASNLPNPIEIVEDLKKKPNVNQPTKIISSKTKETAKENHSDLKIKESKFDNIAPISTIQEKDKTQTSLNSFFDILNLLNQKKQALLSYQFTNDLHPISFDPSGKIEVSIEKGADKNLITNLKKFLNEQTKLSWQIIVSKDSNNPTIQEINNKAYIQNKEKASSHPLVKAVFQAFPDAKIEKLVANVKIEEQILSEIMEE